MTAPVPRQPVTTGARLEILQSDTTSYGTPRYLSGDGAKANHSKAPDGSGLSFTANALETALAAHPGMLEDAFVRVEFHESGSWAARGTPYLLGPGSGTVRGDRQAGAREHIPVGLGALQGLSERCIVLPTEVDPDSPLVRRAGGLEGNRYFGWQSKGYSQSLHPGYWHAADIYEPSSGTSAGTATVEESDDSFTLTAHGLADGDRIRLEVVSGAAGLVDGVYTVNVSDADTYTVSPVDDSSLDITTDGTATIFTGVAAKYGEPVNWDVNAAAAKFVFRDADEGGLTLGRVGTFTLIERTCVKFIAACDEDGKVYLDGPNQGGVVLALSGSETSYTDKIPDRIWLDPGTYRVSFEFTTINSEGGDGNDSLRFACGTIDDKGHLADVLLMTDGDTHVHRQSKGDERPGMSPMETLRRLLEDNDTVMGGSVNAAAILLALKTFTDSTDSDDQEPAPEDCREWVWPLGTPLSDVLSDMSEDADFDLSPDFEFGCWLDRGSDVSATVEPTLLGLTWDSEKRGPNGYLTLSQDGYDLVLPTITDGAPRSLGFFESGSSGSIGRAKRLARAAIRQTGRVRRFYQARTPALTDSMPYTDYTLCDRVAARDYQDDPLDLEVTDIGWEQGAGAITFSLDLGEI